MYLRFVNSLSMISLNIRLCSMIEGLFGGENVHERGGMLALNPNRKPLYIYTRALMCQVCGIKKMLPGFRLIRSLCLVHLSSKTFLSPMFGISTA